MHFLRNLRQVKCDVVERRQVFESDSLGLNPDSGIVTYFPFSFLTCKIRYYLPQRVFIAPVMTVISL